ncbi:transcriptional regulator with sigma factor-related N-terminal domain [Sphaerochaeta pleomorpha str. Grapes]|uniref:Transcriptional regulator with sigma factor-related N-terminal domain n=1 Tax=Sphaerochaeta pleomorpha (strain ATCC BAA-1885 / DSM 22778 / Grapes) TaxID=158190 RepID=G8QQL5_SPHPG|nr:sugar-binding domain-containing protein [Sphaerochaeta pleomorpha]AEV30945.1 transcriptional regulator with sigma factor-related N-terminal domain [Sphaerochaeta pleomorpha str. Grapes]
MGILDNTKFIFMVCELFYQQGYSQKEIAAELKISRPQVSRIIATAIERNLVTIQINYPNEEENLYQRILREEFGIGEVYVYDTGNLSGGEATRKLAEVSKGLFPICVKDNERCGVMAGRTISCLASAIEKSKNRGLSFVPLCGGTAGNGSDWYANSIAQSFAKKTNGTYFILNAPQYLNNCEVKKLLLNEPSIKEILDLGKSCDSVLMGVGNLEVSSTGVQAGNLSVQDIQSLKSQGAVANICSSYINKDGKILDSEISDRIIGQTILDVKNARKVCVARGLSKVEAIKAVLIGGYLDVLITSLDTAKKIVENKREGIK